MSWHGILLFYIYTCYIRIWYTHTIFCLFLVAHINTNPTPLCKRSYETPSLILISGSIFNQFFGWYPVHTSHCFLPWQPSFRLVFHQRPVSDASKPYTVTRSWGRPKQATVNFFLCFQVSNMGVTAKRELWEKLESCYMLHMISTPLRC